MSDSKNPTDFSRGSVNEPEPTYSTDSPPADTTTEYRDLGLTPGERQLIRQMRDIAIKRHGEPFQVSVLLIGDEWHVYESVHRGKGRK